MKARPTPARAIWLMTAMRLTRQRNLLAHHLLRSFKKKRPRDGNAGKRGNLWILTALMALLMSFSFVTMSNHVVLNMQCKLVPASACHDAGRPGGQDGRRGHGGHDSARVAAAELATTPFAAPLARGLTMELTALFFIAVLLPLGSRELARQDWDLEWLVTMPVERGTLLWGRVLERGAGNAGGLFALLPAYGVIAWHSGLRWSALPAALMCAAALLPLAAMLQTLVDTGLRMWLPAARLRNLQAVTGLLNLPLMYFVMALGMPQASGFAMDWARAFPAWAGWAPPGLALQAIQAQDAAQLASRIALLLAQVALLLWGGMALLRRQLRHGVVNTGLRDSARPPLPRVEQASQPQPTPPSPRRIGASALAALSARLALSAVMRRELCLLGRDRNFLFQTLLLPIIIVGSQLVFNGKLDSLHELSRHHTLAAATAFGLGVYVLMLSAFQTLNNEGQALWLLYTVPRALDGVLKEKARLWGALAMVYPAIVLGIGAWYTSRFDWPMLALALVVLAGMPVYAMIAVSLGVFACDPLAVDTRTRVRPTYVYLYMLLASFYTWSIYASAWSQKLVVIVLTASLALALWQKARDALPYLLDPAAAPPARVSTADGLIAATAFFILQGLLLLFFDQPDPRALTIAFGAAGLLVYGLARLAYWRNKATGVPAIVRGMDFGPSLRVAAMAAAVACAGGLAWLALLRHGGLWEQAAPAASMAAGARGAVLALAVVAAPLCEEFIFRGLIHGGLRRSVPAMRAMVISAAIFAVVHPPLSMAPVFVLGLCAAWAYERAKTLLAPMLVHAVYNAAMLAAWFQT